MAPAPAASSRRWRLNPRLRRSPPWRPSPRGTRDGARARACAEPAMAPEPAPAWRPSRHRPTPRSSRRCNRRREASPRAAPSLVCAVPVCDSRLMRSASERARWQANAALTRAMAFAARPWREPSRRRGARSGGRGAPAAAAQLRARHRHGADRLRASDRRPRPGDWRRARHATLAAAARRSGRTDERQLSLPRQPLRPRRARSRRRRDR